MRIVVVLAVVIVFLVVVMVIIVVVVEVVVYILLWRRRVDTTFFVNFDEKNVCRLGLFASIASGPQFRRRDFENFTSSGFYDVQLRFKYTVFLQFFSNNIRTYSSTTSSTSTCLVGSVFVTIYL